MADFGKKHRVIGIRHVLRHLKDAGLVEEASLYAPQAVTDVQDEMLARVLAWYQVGARRGALEILEAFLDGKLTIRKKADGTREVVANVDSIEWRKKLKVKVGNSSKTVKKRTYKLSAADLEFE